MALYSQSCPVYPALQWTCQAGNPVQYGPGMRYHIVIWGPCSFGFASLLSWNLVLTMSRGCTLVTLVLRGIWQMAAGCRGQPRSYNGFHHPSHSTSQGCMVHVWKSIWTAAGSAGLLVQPFKIIGKNSSSRVWCHYTVCLRPFVLVNLSYCWYVEPPAAEIIWKKCMPASSESTTCTGTETLL